LCYAKITPAPLQRGEFAARGRKAAEAAVRNPKFRLSRPGQQIAGSAAPVAMMSAMTPG
jgi:hypothetical protein